jgi:AraC family L-rhamnose operon regulatory protein RhaS
MESIVTIGREFYTGAQFGIKTSDEPAILQAADGKDIYQVIVVTEGSIVLTDRKEHNELLPPQVLCLSYSNPMKKIELAEAKGFSIFFVPKVINNGLYSDEITTPLSISDEGKQENFLAERLLIKPFKQGEISNPFHLSLNQFLLERLTCMYTGLRDQFTIQPNDSWPCRGRSYFLEMLMLLQRLYAFEGDGTQDFPLPRGNPVIEESARMMLLRYSDPHFNVYESTKPLGLFVFSILFKRLSGMGPSAYLKNIRLIVAANLMRNTMLPSTDIAIRCGYQRPSAFERDFKKMHSLSPIDYRASFPNPYG